VQNPFTHTHVVLYNVCELLIFAYQYKSALGVRTPVCL
jgi:hypothetical protein